MVKESKQTSNLDVTSKTLLTLLGVTITDHPEKIKVLLNRYGIKTDTINEKELTDKVITALSRQNQRFNQDLSSLILNELDLIDSYDAFLKGLFKGNGNATGTNPVSGLAGGLGAIFGKIGARKDRRAQAQNARAQTFTTIMAYKAEKEKNKGNKTKVIIGIVIGVLLLAGITVFALTRLKYHLLNSKNDV